MFERGFPFELLHPDCQDEIIFGGPDLQQHHQHDFENLVLCCFYQRFLQETVPWEIVHHCELSQSKSGMLFELAGLGAGLVFLGGLYEKLERVGHQLFVGIVFTFRDDLQRKESHLWIYQIQN